MKVTFSVVARGGLLTIVLAMLCAGAAFAASTEFVIHIFRRTAPPIVGVCFPNGNLVSDAAGSLYGSGACGAFTFGAVFKLTRPVPPSTVWTSSVLYSFGGGADGGFPLGGLIFDAAGNLYGTTSDGGTAGWGTVFELSPPAAGLTNWTKTVLYNFQGGTADGELPQSGPIWGSAGNLYGVTFQGGQTDGGQCQGGCGIVYELSPPATAGGAWTETVLHYFAGPQGSGPRGTPVFDARGDLYGTTQGGGKFGNGLVFRLAPPAAGSTFWIFRILHAFSGTDGSSPQGGLAIHGKGILYGTTESGGGGGNCTPQGCGTVFQLVPPAVAGGPWTENILHSFAGGSDGVNPQANVVFDTAGNLYGTTAAGGGVADVTCNFESGCGVVFELSPPAAGSSTFTETILHFFPSSAGDAFGPSGGLIFGKNGVLFGITQLAGSNGVGAVYGVVK